MKILFTNLRLACLAFLVGCFLWAIGESQKEKFMEDDELKKQILAYNREIIERENIGEIEKKSYVFMDELLESKNLKVRKLTLLVLRHINIPWCFDLYVKGYNDKIESNRVFSGQGIKKLNLPDKNEQVYKLIELQYKKHPGEEGRIIMDLILTLGNTGNESDIEPLLILKNKENETDIIEVYNMALAKVGYVKAIRDLEKKLIASTPEEKKEALEHINYLENPDWIKKVSPLLLDEGIADIVHFGRNKSFKRPVCSHVINTLKIIDPENKLDFDDPVPKPYNEEQIKIARELYGVTEEE